MVHKTAGEIRETLSIRLRALRKEQRYSRAQLGACTEMHRNTILMIEQGKADVRVGTIERLAQVLGTNMSYLMGYTQDRRP